MRSTACLVLDVQLPGMSGLQTSESFGTAGRHIPIIFISASGDAIARALALDTGAVNVLEKPSGDQALLKEAGS